MFSYDKNISKSIIDMYIYDMKKYVKNAAESVKIEKVYRSIPMVLGRENKIFKYTLIEENARKRMYEEPIDWLVSSNMVTMCNKVKKAEKPLKVYINEKDFKLYFSDIGLLTSLSEIQFKDIILDEKFEYKGAITENYIAQEFKCNNISLYFWTMGQSAEIDFLLYNNDGIIPVEVKAGTQAKSQSLNSYITNNKPKYAIRISAKNFGKVNDIKSIPLYAVFCIKEESKLE